VCRARIKEIATVSAVAFDTLKVAEKLESGGFTPQQAKAAAQAFAEASADQLATKTDISVVRTDIEALRLATKSDLAETKADILKWMFGTIGFQTIVILGAALALSHFGH
jgi:hypothetical protein